MSISSLTTIATVREAASRSETPQRPTKGQIGKVPTGHTDADQHAGITDVLAKQIPTELIAPYTALTAALVGAVSKPTTKNPHPDQLAGWRWAAFVLLVASVILVVWQERRRSRVPGTSRLSLLPQGCSARSHGRF